MEKVITYDNGLRVIVYNMPGVRSISCGYWVGVGSADETFEVNGISHFTEHMMFKGTKTMSPFDIANAFESLGAGVNAFTGKEATCYYVKSVDEYFEKAFAILSEIMFDSTFDKEELDKERKVIVEEINMVEDSPEDICYDKIAEAAFGTCGLGQTILGPVENVLRFTGDDVRAHMEKFYTSDNIVISFSGNITVADADKLVKKYALDRFKNDKKNATVIKNSCNFGVIKERVKDFEQSNICLSFSTLVTDDKSINLNRALSSVMGGGMSSRLFQAVREQSGLAYSVYTSPSLFKKDGIFNVYLNISETNTRKALIAVKEEIDKFLKDGISEAELERTKVQLKTSLVFTNENVQSIMIVAGKNLLLNDKIFDIDEYIRQIDGVTKADLDEFAREIFNYSKMNAAYVGKKTDVDILKIFNE